MDSPSENDVCGFDLGEYNPFTRSDRSIRSCPTVDIRYLLPRGRTAPTLKIAYPPLYPVEPYTSNAALFNIPRRYLGQIIPLLAKEDLRNLALVNADFRRFARAAQHAYVRPRHQDLVYKFLQYSIRERLQPEHVSCIRYLDLLDILEVVRSHYDDHDAPKVRRSRQTMRLLTKCLPAMPHLETLSVIYLDLDSFALKALLSSNIKNLRAEEDIIIYDEEDPKFWDMSSLSKLEWSLETLEAQRIYYKRVGHRGCVRDLVWMCRNTLRRLVCDEVYLTEIGLTGEEGDEEDPSKAV